MHCPDKLIFHGFLLQVLAQSIHLAFLSNHITYAHGAISHIQTNKDVKIVCIILQNYSTGDSNASRLWSLKAQTT